ncbi:hypothetical protein F4806DRAFT_498979 [Annulohypoxylon nitens]|nr:hypothetical protein F4806DRAFT_498979 [Annulohypoxylon nitens]
MSEGSTPSIQTSNPSAPKNAGKNWTYRVQGVPSHFDKTRLKDTIKEALKLEDDMIVEIKSLAYDPSDKRRKIATLMFSEIPKELYGQSDKYELKIKMKDIEGSLRLDRHFEGWTSLHTPENQQNCIDLIAVSGLASNAFGSFKAKGDDSYMWLRDTLPEQFENMRILIYGYNSELLNSTSVQNFGDIIGRFQESIKGIRNHRLWLNKDQKKENSDFNPQRPLILLGHSLGGIIIKAALCRMSRMSQDNVQAEHDDHGFNLKSICGMLFFGVPNQGMSIKQWIPIVGGQPNGFFVYQMSPQSDILETYRDEFRKYFIFEDSIIHSFYETKLSPTAIEEGSKWVLKGPPELLVGSASAIHGRPSEEIRDFIHPINKTHSEMVKFNSEFDADYKAVLGPLQNIAAKADIIPLRFSTPQDRLRSFVSDQTAAQLFEMLSTAYENEYDPATMKDSLNDQPSFAWVFRNKDYKLWEGSQGRHDSDTNTTCRVLWLSGPSQCNIHKISSHIVNHNSIAHRRVLYFFRSATTNGQPTATRFIYALLYQMVRLLPTDEQTTVLKCFLNKIIEDIIENEKQLTPFLEGENASATIGKLFEEAANECRTSLNTILAERLQHSILFIIDGLHPSEHNFRETLHTFIQTLQRSTPEAKVLLTSYAGAKVSELSTCDSLHIKYDEERKECLSSLRFDNTRFHKISKEFNGTLEWVWAPTVYKRWSTTEASSILVIEGKPGSGKSTTAKYYSDHLRKQDPGTESATIAKYFYSARDGELHTSHDSMLRSILYDVLDQDESFFYSGVQAEYRMALREESTNTSHCWPNSRLEELLLLLRDHKSGKRLYIIIDAIDEANHHRRRDILKLLFRICSETKYCTIKVLITSRPLGELETLILHHKSITEVLTLQDHTKSDIYHFTRSFMGELQVDRSLEEETDYIVRNAQGVFIWVELVRRQLLRFQDNANPHHDVLEFLKSLPRELEDMYKFILKQLLESDKPVFERSKTIFQFVLCADRPLTLSELIHAACISYDRESTFNSSDTHLDNISEAKRFYITTCGGNILEYDDASKTVQFIHLTVREFFLKSGLSLISFGACTRIEDAHVDVLRTCLLYIKSWAKSMPTRLHGIFEGRDVIWLIWIAKLLWFLGIPRVPKSSWSLEDLENWAQYLDKTHERPLILYALKHLRHHWNCSHQSIDGSGISSNSIDGFDPAGPAACLLEKWAKSLNPDLLRLECGKATSNELINEVLQVAAERGLRTATEVLLTMEAEINAKNRNGQSALLLSSKNGHKQIVELLMTQPGVIASQSDRNGRTPLSWAAGNGHEQIVKLLINKPGVKTSQSDENDRTPLSWAAGNGHEAIVKSLLIRADSELTSEDVTGKTPLSWSEERGHETIAGLIRDAMIKIRKRNDRLHGWGPGLLDEYKLRQARNEFQQGGIKTYDGFLAQSGMMGMDQPGYFCRF